MRPQQQRTRARERALLLVSAQAALTAPVGQGWAGQVACCQTLPDKRSRCSTVRPQQQHTRARERALLLVSAQAGAHASTALCCPSCLQVFPCSSSR